MSDVVEHSPGEWFVVYRDGRLHTKVAIVDGRLAVPFTVQPGDQCYGMVSVGTMTRRAEISVLHAGRST